jgi:putative ABC transport system permease protein
MVESLVLSTAGTVLATVLAWWAVQVLRTAMPDGVPRVTAIAVDVRVLAATATLAVITGLLFGIFPAMQLSRPDLTQALKDGARGASTGGARQRMRSALVVIEVALAVILLVGAALFIGSFVSLMRINPGFTTENVLTVQVSPRFAPGRIPESVDMSPAFGQIVDLIGQTSGVAQASMISGGMPLGGSMSSTNMTVPGKKVDDSDSRGISIRRVTPGYHKALQIPLKSGRFFEPTDQTGSPKVVIINESAAKKYFEGESPIGRTVKLSELERTVVGVVGDVYQTSLETDPMSEVFVPMTQQRVLSGELAIRTTGNPYDVLPAVKAAVLQVLPDVPLRNVRTMEEIYSRRVAQRRLNMLLLGLFGLLGLVISAVGIYGVMAYIVAQRTREIGVRMALGATRRKVVGMVMRSAGVLVAIGLVVGGIGAWSLSKAADKFLFRLESNDPRAFAAAIAALIVAALIASAIPARRAAGIDPMEALRAD